MANGYTDFNDILSGQQGVVYTASTSTAITPPSGKVFIAIHCLNGTKFDSSGGLVATDSGKYINTEEPSNGGGGVKGFQVDADNHFPTNTVLYGRWTSIALTSGNIIAYVGT